MEYTLFSVSTLSSRSGDTKVGQEVFSPYNATKLSGSPQSYVYFPPAASCPGSSTTVNNYVPATYHAWVSALAYTPINPNDSALYNGANKLGAYLSNPAGATASKYYRLEIDTLQWNSTPTCAATAGPCAYPTTGTNTASQAHKGYAVRLVSESGSPGSTLGTVSGSACAGLTCGQVSAMDPAYVALQEPDGVTWAPAISMTDLGASLAGASPPGGGPAVASLGTWPGSGGGSCSACFQTAGSGGGAIRNRQGVQIQMQVPQTFTAGYWNLVYDVSPSAVAGDTFSVEVGFNGTPDHLLP
jgi:hypothetical protein